MGFARAIKTCLIKYADFGGRAGFAECWWFILFQFGAVMGFAFVDVARLSGLAPAEIAALSPMSFITVWVSLVLMVPLWAVSVRRLHDTDRSGFWMLASFVPLLGLVVLVFLLLPGDNIKNRFGPQPGTAKRQTRRVAEEDDFAVPQMSQSAGSDDLRALRHARMTTTA